MHSCLSLLSLRFVYNVIQLFTFYTTHSETLQTLVDLGEHFVIKLSKAQIIERMFIEHKTQTLEILNPLKYSISLKG